MDKEKVWGDAPRDILGQDADQLGHYKYFDFYSEWGGSPGRVLSIDLLSAFTEITGCCAENRQKGNKSGNKEIN